MPLSDEEQQILKEIEAQQPDIVLMDFGSDQIAAATKDLIERISRMTLVIAAAGNLGRGSQVVYPARLKGVLAVGALDPAGSVARYSSLPKSGNKPELHAPESLRDSPLSVVLGEAKDSQGTSFAALRVTAAAALVWSINPSGDLQWVRDTLLNTAVSRKVKGRSTVVRTLDIQGALDEARTRVVVEALGSAEMAFSELQGAVGLATSVLDRLIESMGDRLIKREQAGAILYRLRR